MIRFFVLALVLIFSFSQNIVFAKDFDFDESFFRMFEYAKQNKYKKALNLGLKIKKEALTDAQKKELKDAMEQIYLRKQQNDALSAFSVRYDKYDESYIYTGNTLLWDSVTPVIAVQKGEVMYGLIFKVTHFSQARTNFNKVTINSDNTNITYKILKSSDDIISYSSHKRIARGTVILTAKELSDIDKAANSYDVSFKMSGDNSYVVGTIFDPAKDILKKSIIVYVLLKGKIIKPGATSL